MRLKVLIEMVRKYTNYLLILLIIVVLFYALYSLLPREYKWVFEQNYVQAALAIVIGVIVLEFFASAIMRYAKRIGAEPLLLRNVFLVFGYIVVGLVVAGILGVTGESILASATFSGLIIGLGMQPILSNFFAGLIILGTGFLKPGKRVRIASTSIPITTISLPAYKAFSLNTYVPAMRGTVVEIGLMYTKILLETGELIKIANTMIFSNTVVFEEEEGFESPRVQVRYEFSIEYEPSIVLEKIRKSLVTITRDFSVYIEEQSDKNYYIVIIVANAPRGEKVREFRSKILEKLISIHRELALKK
jgi:small-conductance mechanosensitive channel